MFDLFLKSKYLSFWFLYHPSPATSDCLSKWLLVADIHLIHSDPTPTWLCCQSTVRSLQDSELQDTVLRGPHLGSICCLTQLAHCSCPLLWLAAPGVSPVTKEDTMRTSVSQTKLKAGALVPLELVLGCWWQQWCFEWPGLVEGGPADGRGLELGDL